MGDFTVHNFLFREIPALCCFAFCLHNGKNKDEFLLTSPVTFGKFFHFLELWFTHL